MELNFLLLRPTYMIIDQSQNKVDSEKLFSQFICAYFRYFDHET